MPNWVYNRVTISGESEAIAKFKEQAGRSHPDSFDETTGEIVYKADDPISFWNFIAPPQEALDSGEYFGTHGWKEGKQVGDTENNWYNFQCDKWGTKWDACEPDLEEESTTHLVYRFDTAWSPPAPVFEAMVEQFQELDFGIWWEEEQGFGAELETTTTDEGKALVVIEEWDIPDSHADYSKKDDLDSCRCAWEDNPHEWYDDCEDREETLATWHSENGHADCECESPEEPNVIY